MASQCLPLPNGSCVPLPNWECSDYQCMLQCLNQPTFDAFEQCCIQCLLSQYVAQAKDHLTIIVANAVSSINEEIIPVLDTGNIIIAHLEELTGSEQVNVNDLFNSFKAKVIKQKLTEEITCNDISAPCFSDTGLCTPSSPTLSQLEVQLGYNISCFGTGLGGGPGGIGFGAGSGSGSASAPSNIQITESNISSQAPPITQTQRHSITQTTTQTQVIQYICGVANTCYRMLGIEIVDPADVYFNYQETPTGLIESAGFIEVAGSSDQLSLEEIPSQTTETESVEESVSFILSHLVTATLPVLEVSFMYPITLIREVESVTATRSIQTVHLAYPVAKQTFTESVTATSVSVLGYFQPPVKLVTQSEVTSSSQQILQIKIAKPTTFYQSVPTSITQLVTTLDIIRTVTPERLSEYTNAIVSVLDVLVYQVVTEVLKSFPTSASQEFLIGQVFETVKKVLVPEITSSTQEFLDSLIYQTVKEVVQSVLTSQSETFQTTYIFEKVTPTQVPESTSQTETFQLTYFAQQVSPTLVSESSSQTEQVMDLTFVACAFIDAVNQCYQSSYQLTVYNYSGINWGTGYQIPLYINVPNANSTYSNIRFSYNGQELYSWVEYIDDGYAWVFIVLPTSVANGSSITLDVWYGGSNYVYDGIAGAYKSIAGCSYDNGDKVFIFYDNFCGTSINTNNWTVYASGSVSVTVDNDLEITASSGSYGYYVLQSKSTFPQGTIFEVMQTAKTFNTNIRTASPAISSGSGVCYFSPDSGAVISGCSPSSPVMSWSINSSCYPWWMMESGYNNGACSPSCTFYIQTGINFSFSHRVFGIYYNPGTLNGWGIDYALLEVGSGGANTMGGITYNGCSSSCINECVPSGNVYMYIGTAINNLNGNLDTIYHFARVRYYVPPNSGNCSTIGESSSNITELPSYTNYGDATYYQSGWDSCNDTQYIQLVPGSGNQYGGTVIPFEYTSGDIISVSVVISTSTSFSCPADGVVIALFLESPNTSSLYSPATSTGCPCQGGVTMPTTPGTYFYVQWDPWCCATCGANEGNGACFNVVVVSNNSVSHAVCHTGSGSFNGQNYPTGGQIYFMVTYDPSTGYVYFTIFSIANNQIATGSINISSYFSPPPSGTYYMVIEGDVGGSSSGQYGNWSIIRYSPRIQ